MTLQEFDNQIQTQLNVVTKILSACEQNQKTAQAAMSALEVVRSKMETRLDIFTQSMVGKIDAAATKSASEAAELLQEKFTQADEQAVLAAKRYERAAQRLGFKVFLVLISTIAASLFIAWLIAMKFIPTQVEIATRRQELADMESEVSNLEKHGLYLEWNACGGSTCFRTIEHGEKAWTGEDGSTWRIPYKKP